MASGGTEGLNMTTNLGFVWLQQLLGLRALRGRLPNGKCHAKGDIEQLWPVWTKLGKCRMSFSQLLCVLTPERLSGLHPTRSHH